MSHLQAKSAQSMQALFDSRGLRFNVIELPDNAHTGPEAAASIGCNLGQIAKSLIFKTHQTSQPVLVLTSGVNRVNEQVIAQHVGEQIAKADAGFTRSVTGYAIGGIPPFGHRQKIDFVFVDEDLLLYSNIWAAAGTPKAVFNTTPQELISLMSGTIISIK